jgi:quercetin dioxygenase-like cupin family protein
MNERTFENPQTRERATLLESALESGGKRSVFDFEVGGGGAVMGHFHDLHTEHMEVLGGVIEVTIEGVTRQVRAGERAVIEPGRAHVWRNASTTDTLRFRGTFTPGHPGFEAAIQVLFGLARDGETKANGFPRRLDDLALIVKWNRGLPSGPARYLAPVFGWLARRAEARGRAAELAKRYGVEDLVHPSASPSVAAPPVTAARA